MIGNTAVYFPYINALNSSIDELKSENGVIARNETLSISGKLAEIGNWIKNNPGTLGRFNYVRAHPTESGYFNTSSFSILWNLSSVSYGWAMLQSDNEKTVLFGRLSEGIFYWYAPTLTPVS